MPRRTKAERRLAMDHAAKLIATASTTIQDAVRHLLDNRVERCSPRCKGWLIGDDDQLHQCDECAQLNGYACLDDVLVFLPAAGRELRRHLSDLEGSDA